MSLKKIFSGCLVLLLVIAVSGCGSNVNGGIGKATELDLKEVKTFMDEKKIGFLYVKSAFDSEKESDRMKLSKINVLPMLKRLIFMCLMQKNCLLQNFTNRMPQKVLFSNIQEPSPFIKRVESKRNWILRIFQKMMFLAKLKNLFKI
ncbi:hypothetical protein [Peribacillus frigoritolerans]